MIPKGEIIEYAIRKKCREYDLSEWCESWGFTIEEFEKYLQLGKESFNNIVNGKEVDNAI